MEQQQLEQIDLGLIGGTCSNNNNTNSMNHNNDIDTKTTTGNNNNNNNNNSNTNENSKLSHDTTGTSTGISTSTGTTTTIAENDNNNSTIDDIIMSVDHDNTFIAVGTSTTLPTTKNKEDMVLLHVQQNNHNNVDLKLVDTEKDVGNIRNDNNDDNDNDNNSTDDDDDDNENDITDKSIQYMNVFYNTIGHYLHTNEDHCLIINCTKSFWYWSLLERGYGYDSEPIFNTIDDDCNNNYFAPKLYWKTTSISGKQVDNHKAKRNKKPILPSLFPTRIWNDILYGMSDYDDDDDDDNDDPNSNRNNNNNTDKNDYDIMLLANNDKRIFQYRNQMKIPALRVYVLSSFETCTKPKTVFSNKNITTGTSSTNPSSNNPIHYKYLKRLIEDQDKAIQYVLDNIPTKIYRLHPNDMAMAHIIQPSTKVMSKLVSNSGESDGVQQVDVDADVDVDTTIHLLQNITIQQWAQVKAVDIIYPNRPAIIIDGSDDGLTITITDIVTVPSVTGRTDDTTSSTTTNTPTNTTNKNTTLTIIGQNRTSSVSTRFRMLNDYCLDKLAPSSTTNTTVGSKSDKTNSKVHTTKNVIELDNNDDDDESDLDDSTGGVNKKNRININELMKEIVSNMKNHNGKKFPLYTKTSKFESVSTTLIEVALFLHSIVRTWVGTQLLSIQQNTITTTPTTTTTTTTDEKDKPIIIVTGTDAEIIMLLLDPEICRKVLHLPIVTLHNTGTKNSVTFNSSTSASTSATATGTSTGTAANQPTDNIVRDEADFLNQVEVVYKKHLTLHGITSFLIDMGASCERTIKKLTTTNDNNSSMKQEIDTTTTTVTTTKTTRTPPVVLYPYDLLGIRVAKFFNHKDLFRGTIISYESIDSTTTTGSSSSIDAMTANDHINSSNTSNIIPTIDNCYFMVLYDDGDTEEYDIQQIYGYLKLYDKHFEDNLNLTVRNEKAMDIKRKQSNSIAQLIEQYMNHHDINIGGTASSSSSNKRTLLQKAPANTKQQKVTRDNNVDNDIGNDDDIDNDNISQDADVEMKETTVCVTPTAATAIPIKTEESSNDDVAAAIDNKELEMESNKTTTTTGSITDTPVQQKKRGRPRKNRDTTNNNNNEVVVDDSNKNVIASLSTVASILDNDFINKRVCKLIDTETYCNGTIKKCTIEKNVNKRTGIVTDRIIYKILLDDNDYIEVDDKKEIRKMIRLYDKRTSTILQQEQEPSTQHKE